MPQSTAVLRLNTANICGAKTGEASIVVVMSWIVTVSQVAVRHGSTSTKEKAIVSLKVVVPSFTLVVKETE